MKTSKKTLVWGGLIVFVIGIVLVMSAPEWGPTLVHVGEDGMDVETYMLLAEGNIDSIGLAGGITAFLGGLEAIFAFYFYPHKRSEDDDE